MKELLEITIEKCPDEYPDLSYLGQYTDKLTDYCIVRQYGKFYCELLEDEKENMNRPSRELRYFLPYAGGEATGTDEFFKYGMQDYEQMEKINNGYIQIIGIRAIATILINDTLEYIKSSGLWGIEYEKDDDYIKEIIDEQLAELKELLKEIGIRVTKKTEIKYR